MSVAWGDNPQWPDLSRDKIASEQARRELGPKANIHELLKRAQEIKDKL